MDTDETTVGETEHQSLEALLIAIKEGADAGLARLRGKVDPDSIRRQLIILLDAGRSSEAAELIRGKSPDVTWCELAIRALAETMELGEAENVFRASRKLDDWIKRDRCSLIFAQSLFNSTVRSWQNGVPTFPSSVNDTERETLNRAHHVLIPLLAPIEAS